MDGGIGEAALLDAAVGSGAAAAGTDAAAMTASDAALGSGLGAGAMGAGTAGSGLLAGSDAAMTGLTATGAGAGMTAPAMAAMNGGIDPSLLASASGSMASAPSAAGISGLPEAQSVPQITDTVPSSMTQMANPVTPSNADLYPNETARLNGYETGLMPNPPASAMNNSSSSPGFLQSAWNGVTNMTPGQAMLAGLAGTSLLGMLKKPPGVQQQAPYKGALSKFSYNPSTYQPTYTPSGGLAKGGIAHLATGGALAKGPARGETLRGNLGMLHGIEKLTQYAKGGQPRLLKGPGDGMSDSIPATIDNKQPARLADGEFVVPADVVSHLGNGSTDAGAKHLYDMMDKVREARTGNSKQGKQIDAKKYLPK